MLALLKRYRDLLLVAILLLFPFATFMTRGERGRDPNLIDRVLLGISSPLQLGIAWVIDGTSSLWSRYAALRGVESENRALREEQQKLQLDAQGLLEARAENARLLQLLAYSEKNPGPKVMARVIGVDPAPLRHFVRINRGQSDGVSAGMAVITSEGVAGRVARAISGWADVILLTDASHRMGVRVERSRASAIAVGTGKKDLLDLKVEYALRKDDMQDGDRVVTSGTDGVYPPGLFVGTLKGVVKKSYGMFQSASIELAIDPSKLEEVLVLPAVELASPIHVGTGGAGVP